mgnify:CR=1 FL=1
MKLLRFAFAAVFAAALSHSFAAPAVAGTPLQERADRFLALVNASYQALYTIEQRAAWDAATDVSDARRSLTKAKLEALGS